MKFIGTATRALRRTVAVIVTLFAFVGLTAAPASAAPIFPAWGTIDPAYEYSAPSVSSGGYALFIGVIVLLLAAWWYLSQNFWSGDARPARS